MKKVIAIIVAAVLPITLFAQAQITTKKMKIADFTEKTTKVVLTGNQMFDSIFQQQFKDNWTLSSYEFCTKADFEALRSNPEYYFLMVVTGQFKKEQEPGIDIITIVKGGLGYDDGIDGMLEVVSIPFRAHDDPTGREFVVLPALLSVLQKQTADSMEKDIRGYVGLSNFSMNLAKTKDMRMAIADEDLAEEVNKNYKLIYGRNGIEFMEADDVDDLYLDKAPSTVISYTVAPSDPTVGSYSYKMLIGTEDNTLYFFKRHKISKKYGAGFLVEDIKKIAAVR